MNSGWCWQIEHEKRINRGYVYARDFISDERGRSGIPQPSPKVGPTRVVRFVSGRYRGLGEKRRRDRQRQRIRRAARGDALGVIATQCRLLVESLIDTDRELRPSHQHYINRHHAMIWDNIRGFIAIHYKYNTRLSTPFWKECQEKTDLANAQAIADHYYENGPDGFWGSLVIGDLDPFFMGGYITLLMGQRTPHRKPYHPTDRERQVVNAIRQQIRQITQNGMTAEQVLAAIRHPSWKWQ